METFFRKITRGEDFFFKKIRGVKTVFENQRFHFSKKSFLKIIKLSMLGQVTRVYLTYDMINNRFS